MKPYDNLLHFEKLLDEFEEDALAAAQEGGTPPSASKRTQRDLTRRNVLAFVEELAIENAKLREDAANAINAVPVSVVEIVPL